MGLQEVGRGGMDWIDLAQDSDRWLALSKAVINIRVPKNADNFLTNWVPVSLSGRTLLRGVIYLRLGLDASPNKDRRVFSIVLHVHLLRMKVYCCKANRITVTVFTAA